MDFHVCKLQSTHFCWSLWHLACNFKGLSWIQDCMWTLWYNLKMPFLKLLKCHDPCEPTMSFISVALVGMVCSPRRLAKRRDFSRAISSNSRCLSVSLRDTGIGMARVARTTLVAILTRKRKNTISLVSIKLFLVSIKLYTAWRGAPKIWFHVISRTLNQNEHGALVFPFRPTCASIPQILELNVCAVNHLMSSFAFHRLLPSLFSHFMSIILPVRRDAEPKSWYSQTNQLDIHVILRKVAP